MEHFEFDSSLNTNGSQYRHNENLILKDIKKNVSDCYTSYIKQECKSEYLLNNLFKSFNKHYDKINDYEDNLITNKIIRNDANFITCFFIEDVSPLGNYYKDKAKHINMLIIKQFLDLLENSKKLDYILYGAYVGNNYKLWFLNLNNIKNYRKFEEDINDINLMQYSPMLTSFKV